jgi:cytochrome c oxidase subunit 1
MKEQLEIHSPSPSFWPILLAFGLALIAVGVVSRIFISIVGVVVLLVAVAGWTWENRVEGQEQDHE